MTGMGIRVLATAFAAVPGSSPHSAAMLSMVDAVRADLDLVTVKTEALSHIKRMGDARMFRVPMGSASPAHQRELYTRAVGRQIEAEHYDVVHVFDPWAGVAAAARRRGFTLVYEVATFPDPAPDERALWLEAHADTLAVADRVIVPTAAACEAIGMASRVEVVAPGVDVGALDWTDVSRSGPARLLYLGRFEPARDLGTVLAAIARIAALRPIRALFAGEPDRGRRFEMREQIKAAGLDAVVEVRGDPSPASLAEIIAAANVCVAPASGLGAAGLAALPQPLLEYVACYRPVVAADVPGVSELIRDEVEGLLYPPGDAAALADAILEVMRDGVLRERLTQAAYHRVRSTLSTGARRRRIRQVYESIAPGSQRRDPWRENFEEITGLVEVATTALPRDGEKTRPRARQPARDTQPGLALPEDEPDE